MNDPAIRLLQRRVIEAQQREGVRLEQTNGARRVARNGEPVPVLSIRTWLPN
jgi:hypothetical protein